MVGHLTKLFRVCLVISYLLISWRTSRVASILKGGKVGHSVAKDYRPIILMSFILKTLEKLVNRKRDEDLAAFPLAISQHAYRNGPT